MCKNKACDGEVGDIHETEARQEVRRLAENEGVIEQKRALAGMPQPFSLDGH